MSLTLAAAEWLSRLVQIPSVTPSQAGPRAGEAGEGQIAGALRSWFRRLGADVVEEFVLPDRPNVYGLWPGTTDKWVAVDIHVDTVGVEQMLDEPFSGAISEERVWGRGAVDTKASLGVVLALIEHMQMSGQRPLHNLIIGATVDEEYGATGAPAFAAWIADQELEVIQMVVAEPTLCVPIIGHRGVARFELTFVGESAHSSQPHLGRNAIVEAARTVIAFDGEHRRLQDLPPTHTGRPTVTTTLIHGGTGNNVVPDRCTLFVDRRVVDGEEPRAIVDQLYSLAQQHSDLPIELSRQLEIGAYYQPAKSPLVEKMALLSQSAPHQAPYGTNAWAYATLACETVVIGPGSIDQAHGAREWVELSEIKKMLQIYANWWEIEIE